MRIDAFATQPHYLEHIAPIWHALPDEVTGRIYVNLNVNELRSAATALGLDIVSGRPPNTWNPLIMAGGSDLWAWEGRPVILVEHGAGQSYLGEHGENVNVCYSGGLGRNAVELFLCPNEVVAARNKKRYPNAHVAVVGAPAVRGTQTVPVTDEPVVAMSFHWDCPIVPETRTSWPHWKDAVLSLTMVANAQSKWPGFRILGHSHPKISHRLIPWWEENNIQTTYHWKRVKQIASVFVADNTSCLYEFAALDRPVVVLDAPFYRRDVNHGLRFWEYADVGVRISDPHDLEDAIKYALTDPPHIAAERQRIISKVYSATGEAATEASVTAISEVFGLS